MSHVIDSTLAIFRSQKGLAERALGQVTDEQLHQALAPNTNCIAVIVKHMAGNMLSRWTDLFTSDGENPGGTATTSSWTTSAHETNCWPCGSEAGPAAWPRSRPLRRRT